MTQSTLKASRLVHATNTEADCDTIVDISPTDSSRRSPGAPLHVAMIMDGNGRWARERGIPRAEGHLAGAVAVRKVVRAAVKHRIGTLTLYAFSSDNWSRPRSEVGHLMRLLGSRLRSEADRLAEEGVRLSVIGRRDRLADSLVSDIESAEAKTRAGRRMRLQIAVDYSGRDAILRAARLLRENGHTNRDGFRELIARALGSEPEIPDVDLLIRTGGERRLSDFLLWECAYAELSFIGCLWPDFGEEQLSAALADYRTRDRRFGGLSARSAVGLVSDGRALAARRDSIV